MGQRKLFVNLHVKSAAKTRDFFSKLGFEFDERFQDETTNCMIVGEGASVMFLEQDRFKEFSKLEIADTTKVNECINAMSCESKDEVDQLVKKAVELGGSTYNEPQDHGFMYQHGFRDLDGHTFEVLWMDLEAFLAQQSADAQEKVNGQVDGDADQDAKRRKTE